MQSQTVPRRSFPGLVIVRVILSAGFLACLGCADAEYSAMRGEKSAEPASRAKFAAGEATYADTTAQTPAAEGSKSVGAIHQATGPAAPPEVPRKIIYNAQVTLIVESLNGFNARFDRLVKESGGYVSATDQSSQADLQRSASWTVRVPVEKFNRFLAAVGELGELQKSHLDSQDVTMEYYDLEARIKNKQEEEKRLLKHLADSTGKLEDILAVERELTRVRGEIEQMQGRIRYLGNLSALSTVILNVSEIRNYVPPVRPTFAGQIARTFNESLGALITVGKGLILFAVALAPWLPVLIVLALLIFWVGRKVARAVFRRPPPVILNRSGP